MEKQKRLIKTNNGLSFTTAHFYYVVGDRRSHGTGGRYEIITLWGRKILVKSYWSNFKKEQLWTGKNISKSGATHTKMTLWTILCLSGYAMASTASMVVSTLASTATARSWTAQNRCGFKDVLHLYAVSHITQ